jgi:hypothetical protein
MNEKAGDIIPQPQENTKPTRCTQYSAFTTKKRWSFKQADDLFL